MRGLARGQQTHLLVNNSVYRIVPVAIITQSTCSHTNNICHRAKTDVILITAVLCTLN